ncbi:TetR/AcrR family transcriptional regulator [Amycolatopsis roodepoortensis]|uniref:AcrR family transcriptional regulator n=1 Tax=Amycolatopsis roodepoortensis TaxID=700274 RepID=A0ABR9L0Y1_9PSEU|nr:helix-turn-helix domain-containing protein [Amycolatopsis roodepoortensis]MBE1574277.1 AcrR family transcriptional regulator [Amycolatopsis roodepoortensis]
MTPSGARAQDRQEQHFMSLPAERPTTRGEAAGAASRAAVVRVATELFSATGYRGTSIATVARTAGLSQSGLLHHFPSKTALLTAVLEARDAEDTRFLRQDGDRMPLGWAAFAALEALVARNTTRPELVGLFVRVTAEATDPRHPAHEWTRSHYTTVTRWLTEAIHSGQNAGEIRADAPVATLVRTTIAVLDGLQQQWMLDPGTVSMTVEFGAFVDAVKHRWATRR